jgi:hypothetical protein
MALDEDAALEVVSCPTQSWCFAAGTGGNYGQPVGEVWQRHRWPEVQMPETNELGAGFRGLSCVSARACLAVGSSYLDSNDQNGFADRWNGRSWSTQNVGMVNQGATLSGVSCASARSCTAIGALSLGGYTGTPTTLALHWDGRRWASQSTMSAVGAAGVQLNGVFCSSPAACTAVGANTTIYGDHLHALAERWDGTK